MKTQQEKAKKKKNKPKCESGGGYALVDQSQWGFGTKMYAFNRMMYYNVKN